MNSNVIRYQLLLVLIIGLFGCGADDVAKTPEPDETVVGFTQVDIDANKPVVRGGEAIFGNLAADAVFYYANQLGYAADAAIVNGGNLRFDSALRPDGIYPAGELSRDNVNEMLPFLNTILVMQLTGSQLRSVFERSVHALPVPEGSSGSGAFVQVSSQLQLNFDLSQQAQLLDELVSPPQIDTQGERLITMFLNGAAIVDEQLYRILVPEYIAGGGDGFIALAETPAERIESTNFVTADALEQFLLDMSPVAPQLENRIRLD